MKRALVARLDNDGDVLLSGPAVRAVAAHAEVTLLVGPRGRQAAQLLPGVTDLLVWRCPWVDAEPPPVDPDEIRDLVADLAGRRLDAALILTSFHQSPLPLALLLRMARVPRIGAASEGYPGSLLDLRHRLPGSGLHEAERALSTAAAFGYPLPPGDDGRLAVRRPLPDVGALAGPGRYLVLHPGASVPARTFPPDRWAELAARLVADGERVLVTGGPAETRLTADVSAASGATDLGGRTDLAGLAALLAGADAVLVGNTGPAHLAAAVGTPVVSIFAPTVPAERWAPFGVPVALLGNQGIACSGCRARECPLPEQACISAVTVRDAVAAVRTVAGRSPARPAVADPGAVPRAVEAAR